MQLTLDQRSPRTCSDGLSEFFCHSVTITPSLRLLASLFCLDFATVSNQHTYDDRWRMANADNKRVINGIIRDDVAPCRDIYQTTELREWMISECNIYRSEQRCGA